MSRLRHPFVRIGDMTKTKVTHVCGDCATHHPKWVGQCTGCGEWNTLVEDLDLGIYADVVPARVARPQLIADVDISVGMPQPTGLVELDLVLGGGIVPGSVTLLGGEPGIGKSTLLLQVLASWPGRALYVSAEESPQQIRLRAERLDAVRPDLWLLAETTLPHIASAFDETNPSLVVIDSIQTVSDPELGSPPGSVVQVRACAHRLVAEAKRRNIPIVLVGHVTKDGALAGPRVLEHVVDTVLSFEGDRHHSLRLLRATKHRFGATDELGLFEMVTQGLVGVSDPSRLFLADRRTGVPGSAIVPTLEGRRPIVLEVQALTTPATPNMPPRRTCQGVDGNRMALLLAVLQQRAGVNVHNSDVYVSTVGGLKLVEPGLDLALCLAVASAISNRPLPADLVVFGEVGLGGELRQAAQAPRRLIEAARLGFRRALAPQSTPGTDAGIEMVRVTSLRQALDVAWPR